MPIQIRPIVDEDFSEVEPMLVGIQNLHAQARPDQFLPFHSYSYADFVQMLTAGSALLALYNGCTAGYCVLKTKQFDGKDGICTPHEVGIVENLFVKQEYRQMGIGEALLNAARANAVKQHLHQIELKVWSFNTAAIHLYKKLGFIPKYYCMEMSLPQEKQNNAAG
ncbi:MAG: GNAT family N-acetyltransferase [Oscillospiraceae bacterium]|jgi:ribosomal protein S18 acetylase RimI-like enzyme|nr:GNAT family N-acetyltransferase [Oscillospiraceae bacterium]MDD3261735.1 GNAT family N-acetyltransferase [Oscillospiraceae bacterium]